MSVSTTFPDGSVLTSSALTDIQVGGALQQIVAQALGLNPQGSTDPAFSVVMLGWQPTSQPGPTFSQDACYLRVYPDEDTQFTSLRDQYLSTNSENPTTTLNRNISYSRIWNMALTLYGPNAFDRARLIRTALFLDWCKYALRATNLFLITNVPAPRRVPEKFQGQWWQRVDFAPRFYEGVSEVQTVPIGVTVELKIYQNADITPSVDVVVQNP